MVDICIRVMTLVGHHTIFHPHAGVQPCVKAFVGECVVCPIHGQSVKNECSAVHVADSKNIYADLLSRNKIEKFQRMLPNVNKHSEVK